MNQAYVWGETHAGHHIFFGTAANVVCLVIGGFLGSTTPFKADTNYTCEFGQSPLSKNPPHIPSYIGDWRPPKLFSYTMATQTGVNLVTQQTPANKATLSAKLGQTLGIRSAGEAVNPLTPTQTVVFLAGPSFTTSGNAINVFAFDQTGNFLGAKTLSTYNDIRTWLTVTHGSTGQSLYAGVQMTTGTTGSILKWTPTATTLFDFTIVGTTPSETAYLAAAKDRIYATTWPSFTSPLTSHNAGLYVSPTGTTGDPDANLTGTAWTPLWSSTSYEPDPVVAATYGGGALAVFDTYVYWGTMHVPGVALEAQLAVYPTSTPLSALVNTHRAISIFRMKVGTTHPRLLYGQTTLPQYTAGSNSWHRVLNNMHQIPKYGSSGFGNTFNNYTWSMSVYNTQLYIGTMDWSFLAFGSFSDWANAMGLPASTPDPFRASDHFGADLVRFPNATSAAEFVSTNGVGNKLNYGVRNMVSVQTATTTAAEHGVYLGMADPMNLRTSGAPTQRGGWELIKLNPQTGPTVTTIYGQTADETAAEEFARTFPYTAGKCPTSRAAVIATTTVFQDALSSQYLAQSLTTGTLLTPTASLSPVTALALKQEGIKTVYITGGSLAVSTAVQSAIGQLPAYDCGGTNPTGKIVVHRIFGHTQYGTAEAVAEHVGVAPSKGFPGAYSTTNPTGGTGRYNDTAAVSTSAPICCKKTAILASGEEFQDAQAASVISYRTKIPLLLTPATSLSATTIHAIDNLGIKQVIVMGGPAAVTNQVQADLVAQTGVSAVRVAGKDYTDTAVQAARFEVAGGLNGLHWTPGHRLMVARGNGFADGIAGAVLDNPHNTATGPPGTSRPLVLTESPTSVGTYLTAFLTVAGHTGIDGTPGKVINALTVLGGQLAVTPTTIAAMVTALS